MYVLEPHCGYTKALHSQSTYSHFKISGFLKNIAGANPSTIFTFFSLFISTWNEFVINQGANLAVNTAKPALISVTCMQQKQNSIPSTGSIRQLECLELLILLICHDMAHAKWINISKIGIIGCSVSVLPVSVRQKPKEAALWFRSVWV